jgi:serine/threonine protein kinase/tetratricopeptide (TPR) repeat protein
MIDRFETLRELGTGAFGQVSLVRERASGHLLALKVAHSGSNPLVSARMRREYRALARLQHTNIVQVFEFGETDSKAFLILEYIEGNTLETWLQAGQSLKRILEVFLELALALQVVHDAGLLHRDLKPENVMITKSGMVKLMDFGLSKLDDSSLQLTKIGAMVGTALYMSPEQCRGETLDARSDWYAFGVMLYRAVCGQLPLTGQSLVEVVMAQIQRLPVAPRVYNPLIPVVLEQLILNLLAKKASERPSSAVLVRQMLFEAMNLEGETQTLPAVRLRADRLLHMPMLGREAELAQLQTMISNRGLIAITGMAGIGKTQLLEALRQTSAMRFVSAKAVFEDSTPFGTISRLISELSRLDLLQAAPLEWRVWWQRLAPRASLGDDALTPIQIAAEGVIGKLHLLEAFRVLLDFITPSTICIFEDVQWADAASLELLRYAVPLLPNAVVLVTYRQDEFLEAKKQLPPINHQLELNALPNQIMQQLLEGWLGAPIEAALVNELVLPASGNPWLLSERVKVMLESEFLTQRMGIFEWTRSAVHLPESVLELLRQRIQNLNNQALEFAQAASIFGQFFEYTHVRSLLTWNDNDCLDALEILLRNLFIEETPTETHKTQTDVFGFTHPAFAQALESKILGIKKRRWHLQAATLLETQASKNPIQLAKHYLTGGSPKKAFATALNSAEDYANQFAYTQAETAFRIALEAKDVLEEIPSQEVIRLENGLAQTLYALGHASQALEHWRSALQIPNLEAKQSQPIRLALASAISAQGNGQAALEMLKDLESPAAYLERAKCYERLEDNPQTLKNGLIALKMFRSVQDQEGQSRALTILSWAMNNLGKFKRGLFLAQQALQKSEQNQFTQLLAYQAISANYYGMQDFINAEQTYLAALALPVAHTQLQQHVWFEIGMANVMLLQDRLPEAQRQYNKAYLSSQRAEIKILQIQSAFSIVLIHHMQNQLEEAQKKTALIQDETIQQLWRCRLDLATNQAICPPPALEQLPTWAHSLQRITQLEYLIATKKYQQVFDMTPDSEYQWYWRLGKILTAWRLEEPTKELLETLEEPMKDAGIAKELIPTLNTLIRNAIQHNDTGPLKDWQYSVIGVLARDTLKLLL